MSIAVPINSYQGKLKDVRMLPLLLFPLLVVRSVLTVVSVVFAGDARQGEGCQSGHHCYSPIVDVVLIVRLCCP